MMLSILSCVCWQSVCLLWRNVYLGLLSMFGLVVFLLLGFQCSFCILNIPTLWLSHSILRYLPKKNEDIYPYKDLYTNAHRCFICKGQKLETVKYSSAGEWINKLWYPYNGIPLSHKNQWTIGTYNNRD